MSFDIYGNILRPGHCKVHPHVHQEYPCDLCMEKGRERTRPPEAPPCDICGKAPAVAGVGSFGVCSQACEEEALKRDARVHELLESTKEQNRRLVSENQRLRDQIEIAVLRILNGNEIRDVASLLCATLRGKG